MQVSSTTNLEINIKYASRETRSNDAPCDYKAVGNRMYLTHNQRSDIHKILTNFLQIFKKDS